MSGTRRLQITLDLDYELPEDADLSEVLAELANNVDVAFDNGLFDPTHSERIGRCKIDADTVEE
jgi:hypothetical protein